MKTQNNLRGKSSRRHRAPRHLVYLLLGLMGGSIAHAQNAATSDTEVAGEIEEFVGDGGEDPKFIMPTQPVESVTGFSKSIVDTPRSVTVMSSDLIESLSIRNSEDIARLVPSTYSNFRFGLQGNVNVRNVTSDFYFRGMRRIDPQGNWRTIFAANDSIDIVRGLPSPIYGLGRIGGYVNFNPKTARLSKTGKYLEKPTGNVQLTIGSYDKKILTGEVGGPLEIAGKKGGFHVFSYLENSGSYYILSPDDDQKVVQATITLDLNEKWRMEIGTVLQTSRGGLPGGINRTTQDLIDNGTYWNGGFSYQMDTDRNGRIGDTEILNSYYGGTRQILSGEPGYSGTTSLIRDSRSYRGTNQGNGPLYRRVPWQNGAVDGGTITRAQFDAGYVDTAGQARTGHQLRVPGPGGTTVPYYLPHAFDLAPDTWQPVQFDNRKSFGEDFYEADVHAGFIDFVNDNNPDLTIKSQFLYDYHDQIKIGRNPFSQKQRVMTLEEKVTVKKVWDLPLDWLTAESLVSGNVHYFDGGRNTDLSSDIDFRRSLMTGFTPNDTFSIPHVDASTSGSQWSVMENSQQTIAGLGFANDFTFFDLIDIFGGGRVDHVDAVANQNGGLFLRQTTGGRSVASSVKGSELGTSYSVSVSLRAPFGLRPYVSYAENSALLVNASTGALAQSNVRGNMLAKAELREAGIKGSFLKDSLFASVAAYEQSRSSFNPNDGDGGLSATLGEGIEAEVRWVATEKLNIIIGASWSKTRYLPTSSALVSVDGRYVGFPDVVDAAGNVVIPAEAFGYGGRLQTTIPLNQRHLYDEVEGFPHRVLGLTATYDIFKDLSLRWTVYNQGAYSTDRLNLYKVPEATIHDAGITYTWNDKWESRLNISNLLDELYFNKGAFYWVSPRTPRTWELSTRYTF